MSSAEMYDSGTDPDDSSDDFWPEQTVDVLETLDLSPHFKTDLKDLPDSILYHRNIEDIVQNLLQNSYDDIKDESGKQCLSEDLLVKVGFIRHGNASKTILSRSSLFPTNHIEPIDAIKRFVIDEFKYNPSFSLERFETYDFGRDVKKVAKENSVETIMADNVELSSEGRLSECELSTMKINHQIRELLQACDVDHHVLYHGTDVQSAYDIMSGGIAVNMGSQKRDFSDGTGFYLTNDFEHAKSWAFSITQKPVVLIFKIPKSFSEKAISLDLCEKSERIQCQWENIVNANRSGILKREMRKALKKYDYIEGPISICKIDSTVPAAKTGGAKLARKQKPDSYQLCVINDEFADEISGCLTTIIIYNLTQM